MIQLRDQVEDTVTGFRGTVIARAEWLNGCVQYAVKPRVDKDGRLPDAEWFDQQQLVVTAAFTAKTEPQVVGGPMKDAPSC